MLTYIIILNEEVFIFVMFHFCPQGGASGVSSDSLSEADSKSIGSNLLDALSLSSSTTNPDNARRERGMWTHAPQVPYIVHSCLKHLETYGESTLIQHSSAQSFLLLEWGYLSWALILECFI